MAAAAVHTAPPHVDELCKSMVSAAGEKMQQCLRDLVRSLITTGIDEVDVIHCSRIAVDPCNRDGVGLAINNIRTLIILIILADRISTQLPPHPQQTPPHLV